MFDEVSRDSSGGTVTTFCSKLGNDNDRSVGTFNYKGKVQAGVYSKTCMDRNQENCNSPQRSRYFYPLNAHLRKLHFKMDTMKKVINLVKPGNEATFVFKERFYIVLLLFIILFPIMESDLEGTKLLQDRQVCLSLFVSLGFLINTDKSSLVPSQVIYYLGRTFHLDKGLVCPTVERVEKLQMLIHEMFD